jgi:hypothetical protein
MIRKIAALIFSVAITCVPPALAQTQTANAWFPNPGSTTLYKYHVKSTWYDTRTVTLAGGIQKSLIGFTFSEASSPNYYFAYDPSSPLEVAKANGIYSTILSAKATGEELNIHMWKNESSYWLFDAAQIGPPN